MLLIIDRSSIDPRPVGETFKPNRIQKVELAAPRGYLSDIAIDLDIEEILAK